MEDHGLDLGRSAGNLSASLHDQRASPVDALFRCADAGGDRFADRAVIRSEVRASLWYGGREVLPSQKSAFVERLFEFVQHVRDVASKS